MRLPPGYCGFFLFCMLLAIGFGGAVVFGDPDTAWHLATGDLIRQLGYVPREDSWSYASQGEVWYNLAWLFDIGFSAAFAKGGFTALYVITLLAFAGSYVFMAHHCIKQGASIIAVSITLFLALLVSWGSILARPNLSSIIFTVMFYHLLARYRDTGRASLLYALPLLMALWVNMHGGFLLAFPLMGVFLAEALWNKRRTEVRMLGIAIALCMVATLFNPYGYGVYFGAYKTLSWGYDKLYVVEWQPVKVGHDLPMTLLLLAMLFCGDVWDRRIPLSDRIIGVMLLVMALSTMRHGAVAAALTMPYLSLRLTHLLYHLPLGSRIKSIDRQMDFDMQQKEVKWMALGFALLAIVLIASPFPRDSVLKEPIGFPKKSFPVAEAAFIAEKYPSLRFMTDYNIGGYLIYLWRGKVKLFVDGRASSLYSKETLQDYADFEFESRGYGGRAKRIANQYGFEGAIIPNDDPAAGDWHWNPDWRIVYQGEAAAVYLRATHDKGYRDGH